MGKYLFLLLATTLLACASHRTGVDTASPTAYEAELSAWQAARLAALKAPNGWLNLAGLYWLKPGKNSFGSGADNALVFPEGKIASQAGYFLLEDSIVTLHANPQSNITLDGQVVEQLVIFDPQTGRAPQLASASLRWNVIQRSTKIGIRLRDLESPVLRDFPGIDYFPIDTAWRIRAVLEAVPPDTTIPLTNVLGQTFDEAVLAVLHFTVAGNDYRLAALASGDPEVLFVIFADATTGQDTYGGGRYLYLKKTADEEEIIIDFNKAENPPCVFTDFATCPLPPPQNVLPLAITAGEKYEQHSE